MKSPLKRIVVNKHKVKANRLHGTNEPVLSTQQSGKSPTYGHEIDVIVGGKIVGTFVYRPEHPLSCGASVWFETRANLDIKLSKREFACPTIRMN